MTAVEINAFSGDDRQTVDVADPASGSGGGDGGLRCARSQVELDREWGRICGLMAPITNPPTRKASELSDPQLHLLGASTAARWTLGYAARAPMSRTDQPVNAQTLHSEMTAAGAQVTSEHPNWPGATGVLRWLLWLTGVTEEMTYPGLEPHD
jgi:hypothetical protein